MAMPLLREGLRIIHPDHGEGVVLHRTYPYDSEGRPVRVRFLKDDKKKLFDTTLGDILNNCTIISNKFHDRDRVRHPNYGRGIISYIAYNKREHENDAQIHFESGEIKYFTYSMELEDKLELIRPEDEPHKYGDRVIHPDFGKGTVLSKETVDEKRYDEDLKRDCSFWKRVIKVYFDSGEFKTFDYTYSNEQLLKKIPFGAGDKIEVNKELEEKLKAGKRALVSRLARTQFSFNSNFIFLLDHDDLIKHPKFGYGKVLSGCDFGTYKEILESDQKIGVELVSLGETIVRPRPYEILKYWKILKYEYTKFDKCDRIQIPEYGRGVINSIGLQKLDDSTYAYQIEVHLDTGEKVFLDYDHELERKVRIIREEDEAHREGDTVLHPDYGKGVVFHKTDSFTEDGMLRRIIIINFDSVGRKEFHYTLETERMLKKVSAGHVEKAEENNRLGGTDMSEEKDRIEYDDRIKAVMEKFGDFDLSYLSRKEIENFFLFKLNYNAMRKQGRNVRYNLLISCEHDAEAVNLINAVIDGLSELSLLSGSHDVISESDISDNNPIEPLVLNDGLLAIHNCGWAAKPSAGDVSYSQIEEQTKARMAKDKIWQRLQAVAADNPDCTVIAAGPEKFISYLRENDELYYRFFAHHITVKDVPVEEIPAAVYREIEKEQLQYTEEFKKELEIYIADVYPKADLKGKDFVLDLMNRILTAYYTNPCGELTEDCIPFHRPRRSFEDISKDLDKMVGLKAVKEQFRLLKKLADDTKSKNKLRLNFAFVGNPGTGKTTVAGLTAELLYSMGLIRRNKLVEATNADITSQWRGQSVKMMEEKIDQAKGGLLFIDEAYKLMGSASDPAATENKVIDTLLEAMTNPSKELSVIFAGYTHEIELFLKSNPGLKSRTPYIFVFEDYTEEELIQIFKELAENDGIALEEGAVEALRTKLKSEMFEENFGNARSVENIYTDVKANMLDSDRTDVFKAEDIAKTLPAVTYESLDDMVGLETIKKKLLEFQNRVEYIKSIEGKTVSVKSIDRKTGKEKTVKVKMRAPASNLHMMFTGNPGTGKTQTAKKIADILFRIGALKTNKLVMTERRDLVAGHVGQTAIKTQEVIKKAMNGVLFIDEAYSLYQSGDPTDFGLEAITTLITAMENHKDQLVVIFTGYRWEMQRFLSANPGISSRIGFNFDFPDYTPDELTEIFCNSMINYGFDVSEDAVAKVMELMKYFSQMNDFGNARFVGKIVDAVIGKRASRPYKRRFNDITEKDIPDKREVLDTILGGRNFATDEEQTEEELRRTAIHEAGHAIVYKALNPDKKIVVISIKSDGAGRLGVTSFGPDSSTELTMYYMLAVFLAGRNAERLLLEYHSPGCVSDVQRAKALAVQMVDDYAMGSLGETTPIGFLTMADKLAADVLMLNKTRLQALADMLVEKKEVDDDELNELFERIDQDPPPAEENDDRSDE